MRLFFIFDFLGHVNTSWLVLQSLHREVQQTDAKEIWQVEQKFPWLGLLLTMFGVSKQDILFNTLRHERRNSPCLNSNHFCWSTKKKNRWDVVSNHQMVTTAAPLQLAPAEGWNFGWWEEGHMAPISTGVSLNGLPMMTLCWVVPLPRMPVPTRIIPCLGSGIPTKTFICNRYWEGGQPKLWQTGQCHIPKSHLQFFLAMQPWIIWTTPQQKYSPKDCDS